MPQLVERFSEFQIEDGEKYYTLKVRAITSPKRIERLYGTLLILPEELQKAYKTLEGKPVLKDHKASVDNVIGKVIQTEFRDNAIYATLQILKEGNENLIRKIENGLLNAVSVGFSRTLSWNDKENAYVAKNIKFQEISLVVFPADPDATILNEEGEDILSEAIAWIHDPEKRKKVPSDYFLDPSSRKYPYKTWDGKLSCELLRRALSLSALHGHRQIYDRAKALYEKHCKKEKQSGGISMEQLEALQKQVEELQKQVELLKKENENLKELAEAGKAYIEKLKTETKKFVKLLFGEKSAMLTLIDGLNDVKQLEAMHEEYSRLAKEKFKPSSREGFESQKEEGELTPEKLANMSFEELLKLREKFLQEI